MTLNEFLGIFEFTDAYTSDTGSKVYDYHILEVRTNDNKTKFGFGFEDSGGTRLINQEKAKQIFRPEFLNAKIRCIVQDDERDKIIVYLENYPEQISWEKEEEEI